MSRRHSAAKALIVAVVVVFGALGIASLVTPSVAHDLGGLFGLTPASNSCAVTIHTENVADDAIQTALNAYPGKEVCVGAGTFPEQLTISASGTTLKGAGASTVIEPNGPLVLNTYDYDNFAGPTAVPAAAIILVEGSSGDPTTGVTGVTIEDLTVNGANGQSTFTGCGDNYFGVDFQASSGTLTSATVTGIALPAGPPSYLFGCQAGLAIYAYNGYFNYAPSNYAPDLVTISHTTVTDYQKNGITCDDPQESCTISSDTVTGVGPNGSIAQNGVQIAWGALGTVTSSHVSDNGIYTGPNACSTGNQDINGVCSGDEGAGILLYDAASGTSVTGNTLALDEYGVDYFADGLASDGYSGPVAVTISHNSVDSSNAYGIAVQGAPNDEDSATIASNTINNEATENPTSGIYGAPAIYVSNGTFTISGNELEGSSTGAGASNGATQTVCSPDTVDYVYWCSSAETIPTAAIQAVSESGSVVTSVTVEGNTFSQDSNHLETVGALGGSVNLDYVS